MTRITLDELREQYLAGLTPANQERHARGEKKRKPARPNGYAKPPGTGPEGETCATCANFCRVDYHNRTYRKCALVTWTHGPGSDILASAAACRLWAENPTGPGLAPEHVEVRGSADPLQILARCPACKFVSPRYRKADEVEAELAKLAADARCAECRERGRL